MDFEAVVPTRKKYFFHQCMIDFINRLEFQNQKYLKNGPVRNRKYKGI